MIGIASGLPLDLFQMLIEKFRWQQYCFDYLDVYEKFPQGRPAPAMIFDMCKKLEIDPAELLKVGDTVADIEEGKNAGAITAAILAGTQPSSALKNASPDYLLATLGQVLDLVAKDNRA
jgi:phosphoglycolate phosphatase-like HAD superfamily hydrolase